MGLDGRKKVFDGVHFMLDLGGSPYLKKKEIKEKILRNDGIVVYSVNKKTDFVVTNSIADDETFWPFSLMTASKLGVRIVYPSYIDDCLETGKLMKQGINPHLGNHVTNAFSQGRILSGFTDKKKENLEKRKQMDKSSQTTIWKFMDADGPPFHSGNYEIAKFVMLKGQKRAQGEIAFCGLEIHIRVLDSEADESDNCPKFCVFWHTGVLGSKKIESGSRNCRFTDSPDSALCVFNKLYATFTNPPYCFVKGHPVCPVDVAIGSPKLQEISDEQNMDIGHLNDNVGQLMTHIWKEAMLDIESHLAVPVTTITNNDVEKAEAVLRLIRAAVVTKDEEEKIRKLSKEFTDLILLRNHFLLRNVIGIAQVFEMLQLIRDVLSVNESCSSSKKIDCLAQYKALRCFVQHHPNDSEEFTNINRIIVESSKVPVIVRNVYAVRRNVENVDFTRNLTKKRLLFHGSEVKNVVGILSRGLILPNEFTTVRGEERHNAGLLGRGIYFSPSASTSAVYSKPSNVKGTRMMFMAEVALGETYQTRRTVDWQKPPEGFHSVHGVGTNEMESSEFEEDEFAIFNVSQQRLKYLIEFSLPSDDKELIRILETENDVSQDSEKVPDAKQPLSSNDILDKILYPEPKKAAVVGLVSGDFVFPLKDLKISARLVDLAGQVCVFQSYENPRELPMEAKYVFPLDDAAAVCGFEAYINDKHVVGEVKEKEVARREYVTAISQGHGAYLMDEEKPNVFVVSVGNLPPKAKVLVKITYVTELNVERGQILFHLPGNVSTQQHKIELSAANQNLESVFGESESCLLFSLVAYVEMPFDITTISSPTHKIHTKKTATKAMMKVARGSRLGEGFQLLITLSKMHVPRMWVEESSDEFPEACMLTFYPNFEAEDVLDCTVLIFIDASDSMCGENCLTAQQIALLCLRHIPDHCKFNVTIFGTVYSELFIAPQTKTPEADRKAQDFIMEADGNWGNSEILRATLSTFLLPPTNKTLQNIFVISDGFLNNVGGILRNAERFRLDTRIFTFGVGSTCNSHLLKTLAVKGAGACEVFEKSTMSTWEKKVKCQISKSLRPVLTDVRVEWQQLNNLEMAQAPKQLVSLFSGERQVVYGLIPNCSMATLKANLNGMEISTVVSASRVEKTSGEILHRLTARAIIRDYECGNLDDDRVNHEVRKQEMDEYVLRLSKRFNLVTLRTSFIAIERREEGEVSTSNGPCIDELFAVEAKDLLSYISYDDDDHDVVPNDELKKADEEDEETEKEDEETDEDEETEEDEGTSELGMESMENCYATPFFASPRRLRRRAYSREAYEPSRQQQTPSPSPQRTTSNLFPELSVVNLHDGGTSQPFSACRATFARPERIERMRNSVLSPELPPELPPDPTPQRISLETLQQGSSAMLGGSHLFQMGYSRFGSTPHLVQPPPPLQEVTLGAGPAFERSRQGIEMRGGGPQRLETLFGSAVANFTASLQQNLSNQALQPPSHQLAASLQMEKPSKEKPSRPIERERDRPIGVDVYETDSAEGVAFDSSRNYSKDFQFGGGFGYEVQSLPFLKRAIPHSNLKLVTLQQMDVAETDSRVPDPRLPDGYCRPLSEEIPLSGDDESENGKQLCAGIEATKQKLMEFEDSPEQETVEEITLRLSQSPSSDEDMGFGFFGDMPQRFESESESRSEGSEHGEVTYDLCRPASRENLVRPRSRVLNVDESRSDASIEDITEIFQSKAATSEVGNQLGGIPFCAEMLKQFVAALDISDQLKQDIMGVQNLDYSKAEFLEVTYAIVRLEYADYYEIGWNAKTGGLLFGADSKFYNVYKTCIDKAVTAMNLEGLSSLGTEAAGVIIDLITTLIILRLMWRHGRYCNISLSHLDIESARSTASELVWDTVPEDGPLHDDWRIVLQGLAFVNWANRRYPLAYQSLGLSGNWETVTEACAKVIVSLVKQED